MSAPLEIVSQWVEKAEHDLRNAEHTLTLQEDCPFDTVCYHAQQCAEKYLKAFLISKSQDFPRTHDLRLLLQLALPVSPLELQMAEVTVLNRYAVEARYPGDWEPVTRAEAEEAVVTARKVKKEIREHLPPDCVG